MAEITAATPIEMIVYYAGLRDEYEEATGKERDAIYEQAKRIFEEEVFFDINGNHISFDYYQPDLNHPYVMNQIEEGVFTDYMVFRDEKEAIEYFPDVKILKYSGGDIGEPLFLDEFFKIN